MKKALCILGCAICTTAGLWMALLIDGKADSAFDDGALCIFSALAFAAALLFAGAGNSITWKGEPKNEQV